MEQATEQPMEKVLNHKNKRVCDISADKKLVVIRHKDCTTHITANPDGTLNVVNDRDKTA